MNKGLNFRNVLSVIGTAMVVVFSAFGLDEDVLASTNIFTPVKLEKQSVGAWMRGPFHKARKTWDEYFRVWPAPKEEHAATTLKILRSEPLFFEEHKVEFDVFWNKRGSYFRQFSSPFHRHLHANFSCWNHGAELWNREQRMDLFPFLYVRLEDAELIRKLDSFPPYTPLHIWGSVEIVNEGYPWILVSNAEPLTKETPHTVSTLRDLELAYRLRSKKEYALAVDRFQGAMDKGLPVQTEIKVRAAMGSCLKALRKFPEARDVLVAGLKLYGSNRIQLSDALKKNPDCAPALLELVQVDLALDRDQEARDGAEVLVNIEPFNAVAHAEWGLAKAKLGDIRAGLKDIETAQRLAPRRQLPEAHRNRARVYILNKDWANAEKELTNAILLRSNAVQYHFELGEVYLELNAPAKAQVQFENAHRLAPERPDPVHMMAVALKKQGDLAMAEGKQEDGAKFYAMALEKIEACHKVDDQYVPAYGFHAELLRAIGRPADAQKVLEEGAKASPKNVALQDYLYEQARTQGDWDAMERAALAGVVLKPKEAQRHLRLAHVRAYREAGVPDEEGAEAEYAAAAHLDPDCAEAWAHLTHMRRKLQWWKGGAIAGDRAVSLASDNFTAWTDLSACRSHLADWDGAVNAAEQAFALKESTASRTNLAFACVNRNKAGDAAKAEKLAKAAGAEAAQGVEKANAQSILGAALCLSGRADEGLAALQGVGSTLDEDAWHNLWIARAELQTGAFEKAAEHFNKAAELAGRDATGSALHLQIVKDAKQGLKETKKNKKDRAIQSSLNRQRTPQEAQPSKSEMSDDRKAPGQDAMRKASGRVGANMRPVIEIEASVGSDQDNASAEPEVEAR